MINKPPPFKDLSFRIPIIIPIKGRGFINHGLAVSGSGFGIKGLGYSRIVPMSYIRVE